MIFGVTQKYELRVSFKDERLEKKVIRLFDPIINVKMKSCISLTQRCQKSPDIKKKRYR